MGGYDGEVRIKTSMDLKNLEKDIKEAERKLRDYEKEAEKLEKEKVKFYEESDKKTDENWDLKRQSKELREQAKLLEERKKIRVAQLQEELEQQKQVEVPNQGKIIGLTGSIRNEEEMTQKKIDSLISQADELEKKYTDAFNSIVQGEVDFEDKAKQNVQDIENQKNKIGELKNQYQLAQEEIIKYNQQLEQQKRHEQEVREIKKSIDNVGNSVKRVTGQMIRWSLSLVGINGMMSLVSRSLTLLKNDNKQLGANLNYISFALANAIKPLVEKIVNLVLKLMTYINYIWVRWFGKNLFKDSGIAEYEKSLNNSSKSAKQIKKDLMGFDEVNKLSDDSSSGGGSGFVAPSMDLSKMEDVDVPKWVKWIADHKDDILRVIDALIALFVFKKTIEWLTPLANFFSMFTSGNIAKNIGLAGGQIGLIIGSLLVIAGLIHKIKEDMDETYEKANNIYDTGDEELDDWLKGEHSVDEVNERILAKKQGQVQHEKDNADLAHSIVADHKKDYGLLKKNLTQQDKLLDYKIEQWRAGKLSKEEEQELVQQLYEQRDTVEDIAKKYEGVDINTQELYDMSAKYKDVLGEIGVVVDDNNKKIDYSVDSVDRFGFNAGKAKTSVGQVGDAIMTVADKVTGADKKTDSWFGKLAGIKDKIVQIANQPLPKKELKVEVNVDTSKAKKALQDMLQSWAKGPTGNLLKKLGFDDIVGKIANVKLARGGIINNPGRGVSLGTNIIGGEAGAEAVLPLDDRTMDRLGQSIARHMTINATMINQMNGRTLSREVKQIMNESNFTYNL